MKSGLIFNIQRYSLQDGPGIRTTIFLKGCPLRCWWCHNPEGLRGEPEVAWLRNCCAGCGACAAVCPQGRLNSSGFKQLGDGKDCLCCGACVAACPHQARMIMGQRLSVAEVLKEILKDRIFFEQSGGGVTFSGGEPLVQPLFLKGLLVSCRDQGLHTAVDTCGHGAGADLLAIAPLTDLFLYDLKVLDGVGHRQHTGMDNRQILDNLRSLSRVHGNIWVRLPLIPGVNDSADQLDRMAQFIASLPGVGTICLLPFHRTGLHKWAHLGRVGPLPPVGSSTPQRPTLLGPRGLNPNGTHTLKPYSTEEIAQAAERFRTIGINVRIGG